MTLQEKIDKLPLIIIYNGRKYKLAIAATADMVRLTYRCYQPIYKEIIIEVCSIITDNSLTNALKDVVDRALTIIENKEWEQWTK